MAVEPPDAVANPSILSPVHFLGELDHVGLLCSPVEIRLVFFHFIEFVREREEL